jgi:hypothetical protein
VTNTKPASQVDAQRPRMGCSSSKAAKAETEAPQAAAPASSLPASASTAPTTTPSPAVTLAASAVTDVTQASTASAVQTTVAAVQTTVAAETIVISESEVAVLTPAEQTPAEQPRDATPDEPKLGESKTASLLHVRARVDPAVEENEHQENEEKPSYSVDVHTGVVASESTPNNPNVCVVIDGPVDALWVRLQDNDADVEYFVNTRHMFGTKQAPAVETNITRTDDTSSDTKQPGESPEEATSNNKSESTDLKALAGLGCSSVDEGSSLADVLEALDTLCATLGGSRMAWTLAAAADPTANGVANGVAQADEMSEERTITPLSVDEGGSDSVAQRSEDGSVDSEAETANKVVSGMAGRPRPAGIEAPETEEHDDGGDDAVEEEPHESFADMRARFEAGKAFTPDSARRQSIKSTTNASVASDLESVSVKDKAKSFTFAPTPTKAAADDVQSMQERMEEVSNRKTTAAMKDYWHTVGEINDSVVTRRDF